MTPSKQVFTLLLSAALFFPLGIKAQQNPQPQTPLPQAPALTAEQVRAWLLQNNLQPNQVLPATVTPAPAPTPATPTAEQLAQWEKWVQFQKQQTAAAALPSQTAAQAAAQAGIQYQNCIATERARLTNAANGQQTSASAQNQINNTSAGLSKKTGGLFNLNDLLHQMQAAGIEAKATKNCKALAPAEVPKP